MITSVFNNKPYFDLIIQGKQMNVSKVVYIARHKGITSSSYPETAAKINVYAMPGHAENKAGKVLIASTLLNVPSTPGEYCETVISSKLFSNRYSAIIIEIDDSYGTLEDIGTETIILTSPANITSNNVNVPGGTT